MNLSENSIALSAIDEQQQQQQQQQLSFSVADTVDRRAPSLQRSVSDQTGNKLRQCTV